ncbi:MAG: hypothetical protein AAF688_06795 [Bacteroidota bacterium]
MSLENFKIHLYTTYYSEKNEHRREELLSCLRQNLANKGLASITIFNENGNLSMFEDDKLIAIAISKRPTYKDFFDYINNKTESTDIHIIANTDIFFDEHVLALKYLDLKNKALALSRWDTTESYIPKLYNKNSSQDVWIFKGGIKENLIADFPLGVPRCDNRLLYELEQADYEVLNPSFSIKAYHLHKGQRDLVYDEDDNMHSIPPPYRYKYPHNYFSFWKTVYFNITKQPQLGRYRYDIKKLNNWWLIRLVRKLSEIIIGRKMQLIGYK